jgi:glycosyltransferase involved in cell wall biosynthesis
MRITCISASQVPATTANSIQVMKACQALAQLGHSVHLLVPGTSSTTYPDEGAIPALASYYGLQDSFPVEWLTSKNRLKRYDFALQAVRRARELRTDLIYTWMLQAAFLAVSGWPVLTRKSPPRVILEQHGPPEGKFGPLLFRLFINTPAIKRLLPITQALAKQLQHRYRYQLADAGVVGLSQVISPNGVDLERFQNLPNPPAARKALNLPDKLTIGYTGHLYPGRGMSLLLALARRTPNLEYLWVGGRPTDVDTWRFQLKGQQINNITLTGFVENSRLPIYQAAADILLMPYERYIAGSSGGNSAEYCSPMKMFEYMACGRAIISSDLPVIREVLNQKNAILCPPEAEIEWAQAIERLCAEPELRTTLGRRAFQDVLSYTWIERARRALDGLG